MTPLKLKQEFRGLGREVAHAWMAGVVAVRRALAAGDVRAARTHARKLRSIIWRFCERPR